jgi:MFS transporter, DHA1 family, multidrug resistance protein
MDIYLPGLPDLARDLGASQSVAQVSVATFLIGMAGGQVISGPISDAYGRRRPILVSPALFAIASIACAAAPSIALLAFGRLIQGLCAAAGMVISRAVIRDVYAGAKVLSRIVMVYGLAPALAPIIGAQVRSAAGAVSAMPPPTSASCSGTAPSVGSAASTRSTSSSVRSSPSSASASA